MYVTPFLQDGYLYSCAFTPNVHIFNEHFGKEIRASQGDAIDLRDDVTPAEILDFLCRPIPMCRWCKTRRTFIDWGQSKKDINEWLSGEGDWLSHIFYFNIFRAISWYHKLRRNSAMKYRRWF